MQFELSGTPKLEVLWRCHSSRFPAIGNAQGAHRGYSTTSICPGPLPGSAAAIALLKSDFRMTCWPNDPTARGLMVNNAKDARGLV
jgi:hypothetical protein